MGNFTVCHIHNWHALKSNLFLYTDNSRHVSQGKNFKEIEKQLNVGCTSICEWISDNKISVHLGGGKTKFFFFVSNVK